LPHRPVRLVRSRLGGEEPIGAGACDREPVVTAPFGGGGDEQAPAPGLLDHGGEGVDLGLHGGGGGGLLAGAVELEVERRGQCGIVRRRGGEEVPGLFLAGGAQREVVVGARRDAGGTGPVPVAAEVGVGEAGALGGLEVG